VICRRFAGAIVFSILATLARAQTAVGDGKNFAPSTASFMVNYRVSDLHALLAALRAEGCNVLEKTEESDFGKFGWVMDPEGNKVVEYQENIDAAARILQRRASIFL
jgi:hypothetical protein